MWKSTRHQAFMTSLILVHALLFTVLFANSAIFAEFAKYSYGFLGTFGLVTGGSKIAEKWKQPNA